MIIDDNFVDVFVLFTKIQIRVCWCLLIYHATYLLDTIIIKWIHTGL